MKLGLVVAVLPLLLSTCCSEGSSGSPPVAPAEPGPTDPTPLCSYRVVRAYPHDRTAFTQGLLWADGWLYESTGLYDASSLRRVELETGQVKQRTDLDPGLFGEGLALAGDRLVQLTWRSGLGLVYDRKSFAAVDRFTYDTEGWGLTADGRGLVMSDGTSTLYLLDPESYAETGQLAVHDERGPVGRLNELEYVEGEIWANIWMSDRIARISPLTGRVLGWIELGGLLPAADRDGTDVLNGIAYDRGGGRLFVTGKFWPRLFEITVVAR